MLKESVNYHKKIDRFLGCFTDEEQSRALANVPTDLATIKNLSISSSLNRLMHPSLELAIVFKEKYY